MKRLYSQNKRAISIRIKEPVLAWFQSHHARGYQTAINDVLERHVQEQHERRIWLAGRAQEIFLRFYTQCFWHLKPDLQITPENIYIVIEGLRKRGGREGILLAQKLSEDT